jgi:hypothetical protein
VLERVVARHAKVYPRRFVTPKQAEFADGRRQRWLETLDLPRNRRLDIMPADSGLGVLVLGDSVYQVYHDSVVGRSGLPYSLTTLPYDIHVAPVALTTARLRSAGVNLGALDVAEWFGRKAYRIGEVNDSGRFAPQLWIDCERLVVVRMIELRRDARDRPGTPPQVREVWLDGYRDMGGWWFPAEVSYIADGRRFLVERSGVPRLLTNIPRQFLVSSPWTTPPWVKEAQAPLP